MVGKGGLVVVGGRRRMSGCQSGNGWSLAKDDRSLVGEGGWVVVGCVVGGAWWAMSGG